MRTQINLQLNVEVLVALREYATEHGVSMTRLIHEIMTQFLGLKGVFNEELKTRIEESIARSPGRPADRQRQAEKEAEKTRKAAEKAAQKAAKQAEKAAAARERQLEIYRQAGLNPSQIAEFEEMKAHPQYFFDDHADPQKNEPRPHGHPENPLTAKNFWTAEDNSSGPTTAGLPEPFDPPRRPTPVCARCSNIVELCKCPEGPEVM